jgi:DNA-directed RNA polymerase subunit H (RpoH/RPB5)
LVENDKREHEFVPVHKIMSAKAVDELLAKLGVKVSNLPKILKSDPQAVKLQANVGDVLEIKRNDFGKAYLHYRQVVEG